MKRPFATGLRDSLSIVIGYLPIAFSFGLAARNAGLSPRYAIAMSAFVYAGATQFMMVALLAAGTGVAAVAAAALMMNARHLFYGAALRTQLPAERIPPAPVLAFGLTDEVFATALAQFGGIPPACRARWYLGLQLGAYLAWCLGTVCGVVLGAHLDGQPAWLRDTLGAVLPALFIALLCDYVAASGRHGWPALAASLALAVAALAVLPGHLAIIVAMLGGAWLLGGTRSERAA
ncbi:AzlC family ABC transporter permease [Chitinasiproducens palmae]|uniref:4-azaleucine resistance probable transporter AzlC n=1 Tax=Chitinasiproducens palmae TaxID=1770053 RepID=A0A1H2PNI6_9BURK|nr:AzlC family ABC transporter permease [Chitinasiproducens palmae]SDV47745.1 4-azaleucine resistance probable transporter AzlC [Chitinasiproducens palmae]